MVFRSNLSTELMLSIAEVREVTEEKLYRN